MLESIWGRKDLIGPEASEAEAEIIWGRKDLMG